MDKILLLINLRYNEGDDGHVVYEIPEGLVEKARDEIHAATADWDDAPDGDTIEDCIERRLKLAGIPFECRTYDNINLDMGY